jgi:hypothetical protein
MENTNLQAVQRSQKVQRSIDSFQLEVANAAKKGLVLLPSVNGAYAFDPVADRVIGTKGSEGYRMAVSDQSKAMTRERFLELQAKGESLEMDRAQGRVGPFHYERVQQIASIMDTSPWTLHPDHGCILAAEIEALERELIG